MSRIVRGDEFSGYLRPFSRHIRTEVARKVSTDIPAPVDVPREGIGLCMAEDGTRPVALDPADARYHAHIVGPTGAGKSTLLVSAVLDAVRDPRMAAVVMDVKDGLLIDDLLARLPRDAWERVRLIAPAEGTRTVGLNPLECSDPSLRSVVADRLVDVLAGIFRSSWGPKAAHIIRAGALTVLRSGGTLPDLADCLVDDEVAARYTRGLDDPGLESFWADWRGLSESQRTQAAGSALWKLRELSLSPPIRELLGQRTSTLDLEEALDGGGIVLCSLPTGRLGRELSQLVGALLVSRVWQTAQARAGRPDSQRPPVMAVLDEFQGIANMGPLEEVLVEARSYNLGLVLAHQHLGQLPQDVAAAVYANCRSRLAFAPGDEHEARRLAAFFPGLKPEVLLALRRFQVAARVCTGGRSTATFTGHTRPLPEPESGHLSGQLRDLALERWGRDRDEVEQELRQRRRSSDDDTGGFRA